MSIPDPSPNGSIAELINIGHAIRILDAAVVSTDDMGVHAVEYAVHNWAVFPLRGKHPAIPNPHPKDSPQRATCKGECGQQGHGVLDATTDLATIAAWWAGPYAGYNVGLRIPERTFLLDVDPRNGGLESQAELERQHGHFPQTLTHVSGRGDGGTHRFYRRPPGKLTAN